MTYNQRLNCLVAACSTLLPHVLRKLAMSIEINLGWWIFILQRAWGNKCEIRPQNFRGTVWYSRCLFPEGNYTTIDYGGQLTPQLQATLEHLYATRDHAHDLYRYIVHTSRLPIPGICTSMPSLFITVGGAAVAISSSTSMRPQDIPSLLHSTAVDPGSDMERSLAHPLSAMHAGTVITRLPDPRMATDAILNCPAFMYRQEDVIRWKPTDQSLEEQGARMTKSRARDERPKARTKALDDDRIIMLLLRSYERIGTMFSNTQATEACIEQENPKFVELMGIFDVATDNRAKTCARNLMFLKSFVFQRSTRGQFEECMLDLLVCFNALIFGGIESLYVRSMSVLPKSTDNSGQHAKALLSCHTTAGWCGSSSTVATKQREGRSTIFSLLSSRLASACFQLGWLQGYELQV